MSNIATSEPLRAIIVGCGAVAGGYDQARGRAPEGEVLSHARAYALHPGFEVVACVEPDSDRRRAFMDLWAIPAGFPDLGACTVGFDVASICVPTEVHPEILSTLLERASPRAVWCEKPLSHDEAASTALVGAYDVAGILLAVNYMRRWDPEMAALRDEIAAGDLGRLQSANGFYTKGILANGSHLLDLLAFLCGTLIPLAVHRRLRDLSEEDPTLTAILRLADGAPVHLHGLDRAAFTVFELDLVFEKGRVVIEDSGYRLRRHRVVANPRYAGYRMLDGGETRASGLGRAFLAAVDNLHRAVTIGEALASDGASALATQSLCGTLIHMARGLPWGETR